MNDNPMIAAYQEAFAILTTAVNHFGQDTAGLAMLRESVEVLEGKEPAEVAAVVVSLAQTGAGLLYLLASETGVPKEALLQEVATMVARLAVSDEEE